MKSNIESIVDKADLIVNGYAFTKCNIGYRVLNINNTQKAIVISFDGEPLETTMDDIEMRIVLDYFKKNKKYMED